MTLKRVKEGAKLESLGLQRPSTSDFARSIVLNCFEDPGPQAHVQVDKLWQVFVAMESNHVVETKVMTEGLPDLPAGLDAQRPRGMRMRRLMAIITRAPPYTF